MINNISNAMFNSFKDVQDFFNTMPKICYNLEWTCSKCGKKESHLIEGVQNFLS